MAFRTVAIAREADLHVHAGQLVAVQDQTVWIPIEDIAVLVLESPRVRVSSAALSLLASRGVAVAVCDNKHMPTGILLPHCSHSRQLGVTRQQLAASLPLRKRLWQSIVRSKIENQARCLDALDMEGGNRLRGYVTQVNSGDTTGREATAAGYYFRRLAPGTRRHSGLGSDGALDYAYAILRAAIARSLVGHGFYPPLGIHHDGLLNAFNLADDLLEPYRPFADLVAMRTGADVNEREGRASLLAVLNQPCRLGERAYSTLTAIEETVMSLVRALAQRDHRELRLPMLTGEVAVPETITE